MMMISQTFFLVVISIWNVLVSSPIQLFEAYTDFLIKFYLAPVVQRLVKAIQRINRYPLDNDLYGR